MMSVPGFLFGGSTGLTYDQLQKRRQVLEAMQARSSGQVARNTGEGIAQLGEAFSRRLEGMALDSREAELKPIQDGFNQTIENSYGAMLDGGAGFGGATGAISDGSDPRFTMGNAGREITANPSDAGIYDSFIGTVKDSGLSNPYGLAAVAATGQAESGYSAKNAFGEWSDPSESGGAGQAGGVMSWRADRLANMRRFAAENGDDPSRPSPATQAKFFMAEDPSLIAKLQSAQSVEEAQRHMNNAWRFAGYDRPGGEAARRMKAAAGFLPRFSDAGGAAAAIEQQAPIQVASADPNFMPSGPQVPIGGAVAPDGLNAVPMSIRDSLGKAAAASTLRGETSGAGGSTFGQPEVDAMTARAAAERASNPNIQPWTGPAEIDGREFGSTVPGQGSLAAVLPPGVDPAPGTGQVNAPPAGTTGGANGALVAALQSRQANRANGAAGSAPGLAPMPAPVTVGANPVPPQSAMAGLDPRTSPEARAALASGGFDGFAQSGGGQQVAQALPSSSIPAAPSGALQRVAGAVQSAAQARGVDPRALLNIANSPDASPAQRQVAAAMLERMMEQQQLQQKQAFEVRKTAEERAYAERIRREGYTREDSRFAVTDAREADRLELERQRFIREGDKPIEVGGVLLDPQTMKPVYEAPKKRDVISIFDPATGRDQKGYLDDGGKFVPLGGVQAPKEGGGMSMTMPDGTVMQMGGGKAFTEGQSKDIVYSTRAKGALQVLDTVAPNLSSRVQRGLEVAPYGLGRGFQDKDFQLAKQAGDEFLQAILRKDTGAAIQADEQALYGVTYLPQPGDSDELLKQKQLSRARAVEAIGAGMSPAAIMAQELALQRTGQSGGTADKTAPPPVAPGGVDYRSKYGLED